MNSSLTPMIGQIYLKGYTMTFSTIKPLNFSIRINRALSEEITNLKKRGFSSFKIEFDNYVELRIRILASDFKEIVGEYDKLEFVGENPRPVIQDSWSYSFDLKNAKHFNKSFYLESYDDDPIEIGTTEWEEIEADKADYYSMTLLSDMQWAFSPCVPNVCKED